MRYRTVGIAGLVVAFAAAPRVDAAGVLICRKKNAVQLRPASCKRREQVLDPSELGVTSAPTGPAGGALAGTYPSPTLGAAAIASPAAFAAAALPAARVGLASTAPINSGNLTVSWQQEAFDTANVFDVASPTRLTAPVAGLYHADVSILVQGMTAGSAAAVKLLVGATVQAGAQASQSAGSAYLSASALLAMNAGDAVTVAVTTDSGGTPGVVPDTALFALHWVGPR